MREYVFLGVIISIMFSALILAIHGVNTSPIYNNFCNHKGYDGTLYNYSPYFGTITCYSTDGTIFIQKQFNVKETFWGLIEK